MAKYLFNGVVRPQWLDLAIEIGDAPIRINLADSVGGACEIIVLIANSQLSFLVETARQVDDLATFRNQILETLRPVFDAVTYFYAQVVQFDITSLIVVEKGEIYTYLDALPSAYDNDNPRPVPMEQLIALAVWHKPLARAIADLRAALEVPGDTALFAFRAVEDVMQYFFASGERDRSRAWEEMRRVLRIDRSWLKSLEAQSTFTRHGNPQPLTGESRSELIVTAWRVIDRFVVFLALGAENPLPESLPMLHRTPNSPLGCMKDL
jgi:hypothetical protein